MMHCGKRILFLIMFLILSVPAFSAPAGLFRLPADPAQTEIYLMTVGLGDELYTRFGHTIIRVDDLATQDTQLVNWGIFDFADPNFTMNFFRGILTYRMGSDDLVPTLRLYQDYEKRAVWQQKINLTPEQKATLLQKIYTNGLPDNVRYRYQYLFNNCSTVVRDYFDDLFDGALQKKFKAEKSEQTFRDYIYENLNHPPIVAFFLDVVMNSRIDGKISKWEEMFLPDKLSLYLTEFPSDLRDAVGKPLPLLSAPDFLIKNPDYPSSILQGAWVFFALFLFIYIWVAVLLGKGFSRVVYSRMHGQKPGAWLQVTLRIFALATLGFMFFAIIFGNTMAISWLFSEHLDLHHNINLMLFWPIDLIFLVPVFCLLIFAWLPNWPRFWRWLKVLCDLHLIFALLFLVIFVLGVTDQNIKRIAQFILPVHVLVYAMLSKLIKVMRR